MSNDSYMWNMLYTSHHRATLSRAGRTGVPSKATLYYNNSDIAKNKEHVHVIIIIIIIISESIQIIF